MTTGKKGTAVVSASLAVQVEYEILPPERAVDFGGETLINQVFIGDLDITEQLESDDFAEIREAVNVRRG